MTLRANRLKAVVLITIGLATVAMGFYVAEADDAPGAGGMALMVMIAAAWLALESSRNRLPVWAWRTALVVGVAIVLFAAALTQAVAATVPLFADPADVPSVSAPAPSSAAASSVDRARALVHAAVVEQNLPGISVAVGRDGAIVWAEGFGWRDVSTETPVTPETRFNIGTAASAIDTVVAASLGLTRTGTDAAKAWSPEAIGEEAEDAPPLAALRHLVLEPLGLMSPDYPLPGDRATFYVPRFDDHDPRRGRRLMYMRDLACCADGMALYSTPSDLVRFAQATRSVSVDGDLAGGRVMSLISRHDTGVVVAVTSNIAYADTSHLAARIADVFEAERVATSGKWARDLPIQGN